MTRNRSKLQSNLLNIDKLIELRMKNRDRRLELNKRDDTFRKVMYDGEFDRYSINYIKMPHRLRERYLTSRNGAVSWYDWFVSRIDLPAGKRFPAEISWMISDLLIRDKELRELNCYPFNRNRRFPASKVGLFPEIEKSRTFKNNVLLSGYYNPLGTFNFPSVATTIWRF